MTDVLSSGGNGTKVPFAFLGHDNLAVSKSLSRCIIISSNTTPRAGIHASPRHAATAVRVWLLRPSHGDATNDCGMDIPTRKPAIHRPGKVSIIQPRPSIPLEGRLAFADQPFVPPGVHRKGARAHKYRPPDLHQSRQPACHSNRKPLLQPTAHILWRVLLEVPVQDYS
jgi:hypothetical protein